MGCCFKPRADRDCTEMEINLISASNLKPAKIFSMKAYATVSIGGNKKKQSPVDTNGETNPAWNFNTRHTIDESAVQNDCTMVVIKLYCRRWIGDRYVGEVHVSLKELYKRAPTGSNTVEYRLNKGSAVDSNGKLKFAYRFWGRKAENHEKPSFGCKRAFCGLATLTLNVSLTSFFAGTCS